MSAVDPTAFLRGVERGEVPPIALVHGADAQLLDDLLAAVTRALFPDPAQGGQAPIEIYRKALASGAFEALPETKTLGVLRKL